MLARLALLFVAIPLADLVLLLLLARLTGFWVTLTLVLVTGVAGAWMARGQWRWLVRRTQWRGGTQEIPAQLVTDGMMILLGACLLVAPGLLTDLLGLSLMVPRIRHWYQGIAAEMLRRRFQTGAAAARTGPGDPGVVEGNAREVSGEDGRPGEAARSVVR